MQVKSLGFKGGSVKVLLAMCIEYETDENVDTVILDQWVFVLDHRVLGLRSSFLGLRFRHIVLLWSSVW